MSDLTRVLLEEAEEELLETKHKLEIAVKGLSDARKHLVYMATPIIRNSAVYNIIENCLKDLGVEWKQ